MTTLAVIHADPLGLLVAFGAGMLSFISPCVLPLVPGYVSMVSGLSAAELRAPRAGLPTGVGVTATGAGVATSGAGMAGGGTLTLERPVVAATGPAPGAPTAEELRRQRVHLLRAILTFIAGFTVVFVALGAGSSSLGRLLFTHKPLLITVSGVVIIVFGAVLVAMAAGLRLPAFVTHERRIAIRPSVLGMWAPPIMGFAFAFAWSPCIGPVLGSVLALAAGTGSNATQGIVLLLAYSLGLAVPFLLFGLAFGRMTDLVARARPRLRYVNLAGGVVLAAFGVVLLTGHVDVMSQHITQWLNDLHLGRLSTS